MRLLVVGAGGHAKVVVDTAIAAGWEIAGIVGTSQDPPDLMGHPVALAAEGIAADAFIVAIGDNDVRARHYAEYAAQGLTAATVVHPSAVIGSGVEIGVGTLVVGGVVINVDARIGADAILNTGCTVDHDCIVGDHALIGPQAALCGGVTIGEGVLFGAGATAAPRASVGAWTTVGAGAAVLGEVPSRCVCVGVPAHVVRTTGESA